MMSYRSVICHRQECYLLSSHPEFTGTSYNGKVTLLKSAEALTTP